MNSYRKTLVGVIAIAATLFLSLPAHAQGPAEVVATTPPPVSTEANPAAPLPPNPQPQTSTADGR